MSNVTPHHHHQEQNSEPTEEDANYIFYASRHIGRCYVKRNTPHSGLCLPITFRLERLRPKLLGLNVVVPHPLAETPTPGSNRQ